jgi:acyl dehydratase
MSVPNRFILQQAPVLAGLGKALINSALNRRRGRTSVEVPGPEVVETLPPRDRDLVRCYVKQMGGDPGAYKRTLPAHLFPQWGFPLATRVLSVLDYPLARALNAGFRVEIKAPLPNDEPLQVRAHIASIDDNGSRALIRTRIVTGTSAIPDALIGDLMAIVPLSKKGAPSKPSTPKKEPSRVPDDARELAFWKLPASAGLEFAKLTGDFNPIHWVPAYAKASGFRNVILHGFATGAYAMEGLYRGLFSGDVDAISIFEARFTSPLVLPAKVGLYLDDDADSISVGDAPGGRAYLTGSFQR